MSALPAVERYASAALARDGQAATQLRVEPLAGDASNRSYFRIHADGRTWIVMKLADADPHRQAEEAGSGGAVEELPFLNIGRFLHQAGLPVPAIRDYNREGGWLLLDDLGNDTLYDRLALRRHSAQDEAAWYVTAIDLMAAMQKAGDHDSFGGTVAAQRRYDAGLFNWEFDHYIEWALEKGPYAPAPAATLDELRQSLHALTPGIFGLGDVLVHRDFHSKNLMLDSQGRMGLIDFQDALMGPPTYDLASLLGDAYWEIAPSLQDELIIRFLEQSRRRYNAAAFRRALDATILQRQLKAVGRFYYLDKVKGKPGYMPFVPSLLRRLRARTEDTELGNLMGRAGAWRPLEG